jgi:putative hemolysin
MRSTLPWAGTELPVVESMRIDISASVSAPLLLIALVASSLAVLGALGSACLAVYSPTKLQNRLTGNASHPMLAALEDREFEYRFVARVMFLGGLIGAVLALQAAFDAASRPWAIGSLALVALVACGSLPAGIADARAESTLVRLWPVLHSGFLVLRWPLVAPMMVITGGALRVMRIREEASHDPEEMAEEVMAAVADTAEDSLDAEEKAWIGNIVGLKDLQISTIMTPRPDLHAMPADTPLREAARQVQEHGFSRYPIYRDSIDNVVGIFFAKDAIKLVADDEKLAEQPVESMMRPTLFVPESMAVPQLLHRFRNARMHVAIALDEYGSTAGLVSFEDVLEQIVGDIDDEYDQEEAGANSVKVLEEGHSVEVPGRTAIDDLDELLHVDLPDGDWETVAGYVIHHANRIPQNEETLHIGNLEFHVLQADDRRIDRLRVTASVGSGPQQDE